MGEKGLFVPALTNSSHNLAPTFSLTLYYKWGVKNGFSFALQFFLLISDYLGGVNSPEFQINCDFSPFF